MAVSCCFSSYAQVEFVQNKGQWNDKVNYAGEITTGAFFLENNGFTVRLNKPEDMAKLHAYTHGESAPVKGDEPLILHSFAYNVTFLGAAPNPERVPDKALPTYNNYFIGNDPKKWAGECKIYNAVTYKNIYPNIDVRYYSTNETLKYDFIVRPGGNPSLISLRYDGVKGLAIKNNELIISTSIGDLKELAPYSYQTIYSGSPDVDVKYVLSDNVITFDVKKYNPQGTLVIDPQLIFSSFTGSRADNWGYTATPGPDGSFYAGGIVLTAEGYPTSPGAFQTVYLGGPPEGLAGGATDIAIMKFSPNGSQRVYATYLGGTGNEQPHSMIVDPQGNLVVAGRSNSTNYPESTPLNLRSTGYDIIITKFNAAGTGLIGSVKIGGSADDGVNIRPKYINIGPDRLRRNYGDDARSEVILDASNNIYLSSCSQSADFKGILPTSLQPTFGGVQDGIILKFNSNLSILNFATYFGGASDDACFVAAIDPVTSNLFIGGATSSSTLPGSLTSVIQGSYSGNVDGFVTSLRSDGSAWLKTTYLGTGGIDLVYGLKFDRLGSPYVMGTSTGSWPVLNANYSNPGSKQFISKLRADLSAFQYSTVFGTNSAVPNISPIAFLVDRCQNVYVSGWGGGINVQQGYTTGTTAGLPEVNPIAGIPQADGQDFYFFVLQRDAQSQLFGSHFGQSGGLGDHVDGGTSRFDDNGIIYQAICANCGGGYRTSTPVAFPVTAGVWSTKNESGGCNEASVKIDMNFAGIGAQIQSEIDGQVADSVGCIPLTVVFKDLRAKGITYYWNYNAAVNPNAIDDQTSTPTSPPHTFTTVGTYLVRLIAEDLNTCNLRDTSYITIKAGDNKATPSFSRAKIGDCTSNTFEFTNTTTSTGTPSFDNQSFIWDFGDGSATVIAGLTPPLQHTFPAAGTYYVKLTLVDVDFCNAPQTVIDTLRISSQVKAIFSTPAIGCAPYTAAFKNLSLAGLSWLWEFGDGTTSTDFQPTHLYATIGTYQVRLTAYDSTTCNKIDVSPYFTITVLPKPTAAADWSPNPPQPNVPVRFTNNSVNATHWFWDFGDTETSTDRAPVHEYNTTGSYNVYLVAINDAGCTDTARLTVNVIVNPLLDVPNAFTPGRFGQNGTVSVRGFGIGKMMWRIYNRWGQLVFESQSKKSGWDGYYKGVLQPTDVYTYTLDAEFTDGQKLRKTGDITLIR